jgi:hypothetical protein
MSLTRTTVAVDDTLLREAEDRFRDLGFTELDGLVSAALKDYLKRAALEAKHESVREAARDPRYLAVVRAISEDFSAIDAENLPPEY